MFTLDPALLSSLAHPCIGAFIGYLTNKVAIRMLFRPLRPWHVFGIRVPMTPGVIPSRRRELAANIGEMVGRHLLTSKDIGAAISEEPFQEHLALLAERKVRELFARDFGPLPELIPHRFRSYFQVGVKTLKYQVGEGVNNYLAGQAFEEKFTAAVADRLDELGQQEIETLLGAETRREIYLRIDELIRSILFSERAEAWLAGHLGESLRQAAARGATAGDLVPSQLVDLVRSLLRQHAGPLLQRMGAQLADPVLRAQIVTGILAGIDHFLDGLGPVGAMAKGFLEADTFEQKIGAYLEEKEEGLTAWLGNPEVGERMVAVLEESIDAFLRKRLDAVLADVDAQRLDGLCRECASQIMAACRSEGALTGLRAVLHLGLEHMFDGGRRTLADCAAQCFPDQEGRQQLRETIVREGLALLRSSVSERMVAAAVHAMIDALLTRPIGRLYDIVPHGVRQGLIEYIVLTTNRMLLQEVPGVVESLNLKRVVTDKVDSLNLLQLERLLLSIMEEQFKYINLFGALLGFLIGLVNLALAKLM
ncbi:MAG: DUF445 family protein [Desulfobulbus sp.]|uniref:DUF445 family protein n=1 Tax=Desulfobulbus sp. TaxID=895 RepID=UPI00284B85B6|nr:DUF445 family protein [Desulfobulbus sp.]MDR2550234.1 DUF445 family protein [Desulfobulbus sp.]